MASWVWAIHYEQGQAYVALSTLATPYEALSGMVGWLFNSCIPGTFWFCDTMIKWLDGKEKLVYRFPISEQVLEIIDPDPL